MRALRPPGAAALDRQPGRRPGRRRRRAAAASRWRPGGPPARRDLAAGLRLHRAGDHRAGGLAKALRTVPVVLDIAERARQRALSDAWIIDFTNPVGIVTRALLDAGHRAIGLCNVAIGFQREFAGLLGVEPDRVALDHVGLNHLTWERAAVVDGTDALPGLIASHGDAIAVHTGPAAVRYGQYFGAVPSYYLHYYYAHDAAVAEQRGQPTRAEQVAGIERELLQLYADPALDRKPELLTHRGGAYYSEAAVALLASLVSDARDRQVVNVRNAGTLPFLDDDAVIEVPAVVGAGGAEPVPVAPLSPLMRGLVAHVSAYEDLAVDAALRGGRRPGPRRAARASAGRPVRPGQPARRPADRRERGVPAVGAGESVTRGAGGTGRRAGDRRRQQQDRCGAGGGRRVAAGQRARSRGAQHPEPRADGRRDRLGGERRGRPRGPGGPPGPAARPAPVGLRGQRGPARGRSGTQRGAAAAEAGRHPRRWPTTRSRCCGPAWTALARTGASAVTCGAGINCVGVAAGRADAEVPLARAR